MTIVNVKIANFALQLESDDEAKLLMLVDEVNAKINETKIVNAGISDVKALLITTLLLQEIVMNEKSNSNLSIINRKRDDALNKILIDITSRIECICDSIEDS